MPPPLTPNQKKLVLALKEQAFDKQREVIRDKSKRIALHVGRRGAKTSTVVLLFLMFALMHHNIRLVFVSLSGQNAEDAFLPHAKQFLAKANIVEGIDYTFNYTERLFTFNETGSTISLKGWDVSYKEMEKILGGKCFAVAIDECQSQTQDLEKAILFKVQAAVSDYIKKDGGIIYLLGTAGDFMGQNFWYRICTDSNHLGWTYYTWLDKENPHMLEAKLAEDEMYAKQYGPKFAELDWYKQQYKNEWIVSKDRKVYLLDNINVLDHIECQAPKPSIQFLATATYGLGIDFGFSPDPMAFIVVAYNKQFSNKLYVIEEFSQTEMFIGDVSAKIKEFDKRYHFTFQVADAGAQAKAQVADLNTNYGHRVVAADKPNKFAHQNTINGDFKAGNIVIDPKACPQLIAELGSLVWDPVALNTDNRRIEKEGMANHLCDALLYIHHHCRHLWYQPPAPTQPMTQQDINYLLMKDLIGRNKKANHGSSIFDGINFANNTHKKTK